MIRYFSPDSSECSRRISVAQSTYSGIDRSSRPTNSDHRVLGAGEQRHARDRGQQQRVELAVRGFAWPRASARRAAPCRCRRRSGSCQRERQVVDRAARRRRSTCRSFHCQIVSPSAAPSATQAERRHDLRAHPAASRAARRAARATAPPSSASSGESAAKSMCGPFRWRWRAASAALIRRARRRRRRRRRRVGGRPATRVGSRRASAAPARPHALTDAFAAMQRQLRVQREQQDHARRTARARAPSRQRDLARVDVRPDAVVHRADEQPQRVDARHHHAA